MAGVRDEQEQQDAREDEASRELALRIVLLVLFALCAWFGIASAFEAPAARVGETSDAPSAPTD